MKEELNNLIKRMEILKNQAGQREPASYHCKKCRDTELIVGTWKGEQIYIRCECVPVKEVKRNMDKSGLGDLLETKRFSNFETHDEHQKVAKRLAIEYVEEFLEGNRHSFAILGQSGIGKTHLMAAIARELTLNNVKVRYYVADEIIQNLQACKFDEQNYNREFGDIANAEVLLIDDLFKTSITNYYNQESINPNDLKEMFKIINYRYNKKLPILLSSEIYFERFMKLDQAVIGRINEMCDFKYLITVKPDGDKNYRLMKQRSL